MDILEQIKFKYKSIKYDIKILYLLILLYFCLHILTYMLIYKRKEKLGGRLMNIRYTKNYDKGLKELKKKCRTKQLDNLKEILELIKNSCDFNELKNNPLVCMILNH